jgi:hypothetical protein
VRVKGRGKIGGWHGFPFIICSNVWARQRRSPESEPTETRHTLKRLRSFIPKLRFTDILQSNNLIINLCDKARVSER